MSSIPAELYNRVREVVWAIVKASEADDEILNLSLCQTLREFYDEQVGLGRSHPFLTEAMADFTNDPIEAVRLYHLSIVEASEFPDELTYTKKISLARALVELGRPSEAEAYLRDGRTEAVRFGDTFWISDADELLRRMVT